MIKRVMVFYFLCFSCFAFGNFEFGVGYKSNKIDDAPKRSNGLELSLGKKYFFNENLGAKTSFDISFTGFTDEFFIKTIKVSEFKFREYNYGIGQRLFYQFPLDNFKLIPFVNIGLGYSYSTYKYTSVLFYGEDTKSRLYFKYGLGFQVLSAKGIGGEFAYGGIHNKDFDSKYTTLSFIYSI